MAQVEQLLLTFLQSKAAPASAQELIEAIKQANIPDADIRQALWRLIDRHEVELTRERKLIAHSPVGAGA